MERAEQLQAGRDERGLLSASRGRGRIAHDELRRGRRPADRLPGSRTLTVEDIKDGTKSTIMFVEIANSDINWMEPRDLVFDQMSFRVNDPKGKGLGSPYGGTRIALMRRRVCREVKTRCGLRSCGRSDDLGRRDDRGR